MNSKPLRILLLVTVALADSRYSWGKYKSIVRDDGLRKGSPPPHHQDAGAQDDQQAIPDKQVDLRSREAYSADAKMQATALAEESPEKASNESNPSTSATGNSSDFVETSSEDPATEDTATEDTATEDNTVTSTRDVTLTRDAPPPPTTNGGGGGGGGGGEPSADEAVYPFDTGEVVEKLTKSKGRGKLGDDEAQINKEAAALPKQENFQKSNAYFKEIVKDTMNLAKATDMIHKELKQHRGALDDFKEKQEETTAKYNAEMEKVKAGFSKFAEEAGKLAADGDEAPLKSHGGFKPNEAQYTPEEGIQWFEPAGGEQSDQSAQSAQPAQPNNSSLQLTEEKNTTSGE